ncbi:MAG TPA: divalent metal cation transporter [Verrucomicrobiae bacterium]|nr:divalent metal cation transporter [Verrucomicrobiae bacterium]
MTSEATPLAEPQRERTPALVRPGFVAGASANDPTTVGSLAAVGATTIYGLAWLVIAILPMLAVTQMIAASVGAATRTSVQGAIVRRYGIIAGLLSLAAIVAVNLLTLIADIEAGCQALSLVVGLPYQWFLLPFAAAIAYLLLTHSYGRIATWLMFVPILFVAYAASAALARVDWLDVARHTFVPHFEFSRVYVIGALALIGTTITSYEYVWESIEVAQSRRGPSRLGALKLDAVLGVLAAGAGFLFVLVASGATLGVHHLPIETVDDAARALAPLAGPAAGALFGIGLFASAVLTVPILAASTAYAVAHTFGSSATLDARVAEAKPFYAIILAALLVGAGASLFGFPPIRLLVWASIAGGLGTPFTLVLMSCVARSRRAMGDFRISLPLSIAGWTVTALIVLTCAAYLALSSRA